MKPVHFHQMAEQDIEAAADSLELRASNLGRDFTLAVQSLVAEIAAAPGLGSPYGRGHFRFRVMRRFLYVVYYREYDDLVWIAAVVYGRRRLRSWTDRDRN